MRFRLTTVVASTLLLSACSQGSSASPASGAQKSAPAKPAAKVAATAKMKFEPFQVVDDKQDGMVVSRLAIPQNWKGTSRVVWNMNDFYQPVYASARLQSPDGASWIEFYPAEFFLWLDPQHDRSPIGPGSIGGIHHPNITLPEALVRYVIAPNRQGATNLKILGYRPVNNLLSAFPRVFVPGQPMPQGEAICMRVSYQIDGSPVDEEFYAFMTAREAIPGPNPRIPIMEYHRRMILAHSMGAKSGKLEAIRPLLGFVATSIEPNAEWQKRVGEVMKMQQQYYQRVMAQNYAGIQAAGERARLNAAQSDQFLRQIDANLAQSRAAASSSSSFSQSSTEDFYKRADDFDQNIRGTEHMRDQYGQVSDQPNDYNYHWTDGFGNYVHTNDANLDPNRYLNGNYQQMTPATQ